MSHHYDTSHILKIIAIISVGRFNCSLFSGKRNEWIADFNAHVAFSIMRNSEVLEEQHAAI